MKYKLTLAFDGSAFSGWQAQKNALSVQEEMTRCAKQLLGQDATVTGSSRTDSKVHALGFVCHITSKKSLSCLTVKTALNHTLDSHIAVLSCEEVSDDFHARYSTVSKEYHYVIFDGEVRDPFLNSRVWFYKRRLDEKKMNDTAKEFLGEHDFTSFMASGSKITDAVRCVHSACVEREGDKVVFKVCADGFLYNMVRIMTGTLVDIERGAVTKSIEEIIESKDRNKAGITAPACGLYLYKVNY